MDLPLTGSHVIASSEIVGSYSGFQLTVEAAGIRTVRYAPLAVDCPAGTPAWFFEKGPGICPQNAPLHSFAAVQRFEHGLMIWLETLDEFYVLLDHDHHVADPSQGESGATSLCIIRGPLALRSGASADNRVPEEPPVGMYQPVSGFGLVWRGEVEGTGDIRAALGWALEREYGFETVTQCELPCGAHWNCYLQGPTGRVFHFYYQFHFGHYWEVTG
jgi:hypothetical protein